MARAKNTPMHEGAKKVVSSNLVRLMNSKGITQVELAEKTGIPPTTINGYFKGTSLPTPGNTEKLAMLFNVSKEKIDPRFQTDAFNNYDITAAKVKLNAKETEFFDHLIEKTLSLNKSEREDFLENVRFAIEFFDKKKK